MPPYCLRIWLHDPGSRVKNHDHRLEVRGIRPGGRVIRRQNICLLERWILEYTGNMPSDFLARLGPEPKYLKHTRLLHLENIKRYMEREKKKKPAQR